MANQKISAMSSAAALDGTEAFPAVQSNANVKALLTDVATYIDSVDHNLLGDISVSGSAVFVTNVHVKGGTTLSGAVVCLTTLAVSATASVGALNIAGTTFTPGSYLTSASARSAIATDVLNVSLTASVGSLNVVGTTNLQGATTASGAVNMLTTLSVSGNADFRGAVSVSGALTCLTALNVSATASLGQLYVATTSTLSGAVNCLTTLSVSGAAVFKTDLNVSATASCGVVTYGGFQISGMHKLGSASGANNTILKISGTWTNYQSLQVVASGKGQTTSTNFILNLYTDGGTTPIMTYNAVANASATASEGMIIADIFGANADAGFKLVTILQHFPSVATQATQTRSATVNTSALNCVGLSIGAGATTATISAAHFCLYGQLK